MRSVKKVFVFAVGFGLLIASSVFAVGTIVTPNGPQFYGRAQVVSGNGGWDPADGNNGKMDFGIKNGLGVIVTDANQGAVAFQIVDLGAQFGFPNVMLVWAATAAPNANGWTPSPPGNIVILGFAFPFPDHFIALKRVQLGIDILVAQSGPHLVF